MDILLKRKVLTPNTTEQNGQTPLLRVVQQWHGEVVGMLLKREDINPNTAENDGRTPVSWATENERGEVVEMLLERERGGWRCKFDSNPLFSYVSFAYIEGYLMYIHKQ